MTDTKALVASIYKNAVLKAVKREEKIERALASSRLVLLSFHEFLNVTGYSINKYMVDKFFHSIKDDIPIYIDNELIKWCGYGGPLKLQKQMLMKLIKKCEVELIELDNDEYEQFREDTRKLCMQSHTQNQPDDKSDTDESDSDNSEDESSSEGESEDDFNTMYPEVDRSNGKGKTKHALVPPDDFKMVVMRLPTTRGKQVCKYYIKFERIVREYVKYQVQFLTRREELLEIELKESREERRKAEAERQKAEAASRVLQETVEDLRDDIEEVKDMLDCATDDRVPKTIKRNLLERFVLMKLNDQNPNTHDFYVIRAQRRGVTTAIARLQNKFPNAERILTIRYQPNSKNLFNRMKESMAGRIDVSGNYVSPINLSHDRFIERVMRLNAEKKSVE